MSMNTASFTDFQEWLVFPTKQNKRVWRRTFMAEASVSLGCGLALLHRQVWTACLNYTGFIGIALFPSAFTHAPIAEQ